jgi:hypothetical protein
VHCRETPGLISRESFAARVVGQVNDLTNSFRNALPVRSVDLTYQAEEEVSGGSRASCQADGLTYETDEEVAVATIRPVPLNFLRIYYGQCRKSF